MSTTSNRDRLLRMLGPVVAAEGADLEDVTLTPAGRRRLLRVVVDRDDGVNLEQVAVLSQAISAVLDGAEMMSGPYVLEITSPGVDRPLSTPRHWRRAVSRLVKAVLVEEGELVGRVLAADDSGVTLDVGGRERRLAYAQIGRATVQVEFARAGAGGGERGGPGEQADPATTVKEV